MKILAIETSSRAGSAALMEEDRLIGESYLDGGLTHSQTALPMVQQVLRLAGTAWREVDAFAVSVGPGSFTGLRIGIATVKGLADAQEKPCYGISTLEGLAWNLAGFAGWICPVLDARCGQIYTALFYGDGERVLRRGEDLAMAAAQRLEELCALEGPIWLVGDGAKLCYDGWKSRLPGLRLAPAALRQQRASSLAAAALAGAAAPVPADQLAPVYLRRPQAERERLAKLQQEGAEL